MAGEISTESKIKLGLAVAATLGIIKFTNYIGSIDHRVEKLQLLLEGRLQLAEQRITQMENNLPSHKAAVSLPAAALTSRAISGLNDIQTDEE